VIPVKPFVVDIESVDSKNNVSKRRLEADSMEMAEHLLAVHSQLGNVTHITIARRLGGPGRRVSKVKAWRKTMA
jgi:hypothetical protein